MNEEKLVQTLNLLSQDFYKTFILSMKNISIHDLYLLQFLFNPFFILFRFHHNTKQTSDNGFPQYIMLFRTSDTNARNILLTIIYGTLIPSIICANLLLIVGITKTKRNKFTSSQILFLTLFLNDLTFGVVQLPKQIYFLSKSREPICLDV